METLRIGFVAKPQGVRGELKVLPLTDDPARFEALKSVLIEEPGGYRLAGVESAGVRADCVVLKLAGVDDRNAAEGYRERYLCVERKDAVKLPEGRYFIADLVGCAVTDTGGDAHGTLTEVLEYPANHVYVITGPLGKSFMVPAIKALLAEVDVQNKRVVLDADVLPQVMVGEGMGVEVRDED